MTFDDALIERVKNGARLETAIPLAMRDAGLTKEPTLRDVQRAVAANPNHFPPAYRKLT